MLPREDQKFFGGEEAVGVQIRRLERLVHEGLRHVHVADPPEEARQVGLGQPVALAARVVNLNLFVVCWVVWGKRGGGEIGVGFSSYNRSEPISQSDDAWDDVP